MTSPYSDLSPNAFWSSGVAERAPLDPGELYDPKKRFHRKTRFVTAGSCFAQHIGRTLRTSGLTVLDGEPLPKNVDVPVARHHGYGLYSARYGNIYTVRQMLQLLREEFGNRAPEDIIWEKGGRYFDALRPTVEPNGLPSATDVLEHRAQHLKAVRSVFSDFDVFVFTLGLTEAWVSRRDGTVYPTCPGTVAGEFDPEHYEFHNFRFREIWDDFLKLRRLIKTRTPKARFVLTVSPVPLTATASGQHVEVATSYSKALLRAVAGGLADRLANVDYFPSYEVITSQNARGAYFESNMRSVSAQGVETAMSLFMRAHGLQHNPRRARVLRDKRDLRQEIRVKGRTEEEICEDSILQAFAK